MVKNNSRIIRDKKMVLLNPLIKDNIIIIHDPENINISRACIIGPKDTPYKHGFYFFEFLFPNNYPYEPFKVKFFTNNGITRMHPNFYSCGKVCVSIIGTWTGPGWTSCQNLYSVLLTFLSLFIENPLHQEPGFEKDYSNNNTNYNKLIHHENLNIGIIRMINNIPTGFEEFLPLIIEYLHFNKKDILNECDTIYKAHTQKSPSMWNFSVNIDYNKRKEELEKILDTTKILSEDYINTILDKLPNTINYKGIRELFNNIDINIDLQNILNILQIRNKINIIDGIIKKI